MSMSTDGQGTSSQPPQRRGIEVKQEWLDAAWKQRWTGARAKYPEELINNVGMVRGLFKSPDAPSTEDQVFIVCRADSYEEGQDGRDIVEVYSSVPAANEHVLLLFAKEHGDCMTEGCSWSQAGAQAPGRNQLTASTQMAWSFSPHACLTLEVLQIQDEHKAGPRVVWVEEKWIEAEPSEPLARSVFG